MVDIMMPKPQQETSIGRRLFGMAAPIVGGAVGGMPGALAGGLIGSKMAGASTQDAALSGLQSGLGYKDNGTGTTDLKGAGDTEGDIVGAGAGGAMGRRLDAASEDPGVTINNGLSILSSLPPDDPLRQEYAGPLIKARMKASGQLPGL